MNRIPVAIASALLADMLARFGLAGFVAAQTALPLVLTYLVGRQFWPRFAVLTTLVVAISFVAAQAYFTWASVAFGIEKPVFMISEFTLAAFLTLALPFFIAAMASQNLPGVATITARGFGDRRTEGGDAGIPVSTIITLSGVATSF